MAVNAQDSIFFWDRQIINLDTFVARLKQTENQDKVSHYLSSRLSTSTQYLLSNYTGGLDLQLRHALATDLDRIVDGNRSIYDSQRFAGVKLSDETARLLNRKPNEYNLRWLNRLLIENVYPHEIARHSGLTLLDVSLSHRNITGKKTAKYLQVQDTLLTELAKAFGPALRMQETVGWVP